MHWPLFPVELISPERFRPPFCPLPDCPRHHRTPDQPFPYRRHGSFIRLCDGRRVPRYLCSTCRHTFSLQTFAFSYYLKRPELTAAIAAALVAGSAHRQIARSQSCSPGTVTRQAARIGRHTLLLLELARRSLPDIPEPVIIDDFESFAWSQFFPFGLSSATGRDSWFVYSLDYSPHRRSGRLTPSQRLERDALDARHGRPARGAYRWSFHRQLDRLLGPARGQLVVISDAHRSYAVARDRHPQRGRIEHRVFPNPARGGKGAPRSSQAVTRDREMFANDLLHRIIRHSQAHHRRETIAFGRRHNALIERGMLLAIWRNFVKARSERVQSVRRTPAMHLALARSPWGWERVFARRLQPSKVRPGEADMRVYRREIVTPPAGNNRKHDLMRAF